jgi:hypothetical protein
LPERGVARGRITSPEKAALAPVGADSLDKKEEERGSPSNAASEMFVEE